MGGKITDKPVNTPITGIIDNGKFEGSKRSWGLKLGFLFRRKIDLDYVAERLRSILEGNCMGYAYAIDIRGKRVITGSGGSARQLAAGNDPSGLDTEAHDIRFQPDTVMTTASVGKVFTALLAVRVLRDKKIPLSTSISTYLPSLWPQAQAIASLSFLDLLTHKSGLGAGQTFVDGETDLTFARRMIAIGPTGPGGYHNVNYILLRILIYQILSFSGKDDAIPLTPPTALDVNWAVQDGLLQDRSATFFDELAHAKIFNPAGVTASLDPPPGRAWHYRWPNLGQHGELGDISGGAGSGGWYMTAVGVARAAQMILNGEVLLPADVVAQALERGMGVDGSGSIKYANIGWVHVKGGSSHIGLADGSVVYQGSYLFLMPEGVALAIFANSNVASPSDLGAMVFQAIRDAILDWSVFTGFLWRHPLGRFAGRDPAPLKVPPNA